MIVLWKREDALAALLVVLPIPDHPRTWSTLNLSSTPKTPRAPHRRSCRYLSRLEYSEIALISLPWTILQFAFSCMYRSSLDHDACIVQFVFEARNEDASKALKCFFVWSWCRKHCAVCFWGEKRPKATGPESSGSVSFDKNKGRWTRWRKINSSRKELMMQAKHSNYFSFDHEMHVLWILGKKWGREQSTQMFLRLIKAKMPDILIQASCLHLQFHRWDLPLLFYYLCL